MPGGQCSREFVPWRGDPQLGQGLVCRTPQFQPRSALAPRRELPSKFCGLVRLQIQLCRHLPLVGIARGQYDAQVQLLACTGLIHQCLHPGLKQR
jgi:hypothetical protein